MVAKENEVFIPEDVALMVVRENIPLFKAWRLRLNMTVEEIAAAAGLLPMAVSAFDKRENTYSLLLHNIAMAMNLDVDQLVDISN